MLDARHGSITTPPPNKTLYARGGGGVFTGTLATGPPSPIYAKHTTINGSRPGFIVTCIIAGLIFFSILGGGYWWFRRRRSRLSSTNDSNTRRYSTSNRMSGMFGRKSTSERGNHGGKWATLDDQDDAFTTNVSMVDLNDPHETSAYEYPRKWNPVYAASGESIDLKGTGNRNEESENRKQPYLDA